MSPQELLGCLAACSYITARGVICAPAMQGKRIGVMSYLAVRTGYSSSVLEVFNQAVADLEAAGAEIVPNMTITVRLGARSHRSLLAEPHALLLGHESMSACCTKQGQVQGVSSNESAACHAQGNSLGDKDWDPNHGHFQ